MVSRPHFPQVLARNLSLGPRALAARFRRPSAAVPIGWNAAAKQEQWPAVVLATRTDRSQARDLDRGMGRTPARNKDAAFAAIRRSVALCRRATAAMECTNSSGIALARSPWHPQAVSRSVIVWKQTGREIVALPMPETITNQPCALATNTLRSQVTAGGAHRTRARNHDRLALRYDDSLLYPSRDSVRG